VSHDNGKDLSLDGLIQDPNAPPAPPDRHAQYAEIHIRMDRKTGEIEMLEAPLQERLLCYGLLEVARDIIYRAHLPQELATVRQAMARAQQKTIVPATGPLPRFHKR